MNSPTKQQLMKYQLRLAVIRQEHRDLDAAIHAILSTDQADPMLVQRLKKKKLHLKDDIAALEQLVVPDIIA